MHLDLLPSGRRLNRCCPGLELSLIISIALLRCRGQGMSSKEGSGQPTVLWAAFMSLCRALLSATEQLAYHTAMLSANALSKSVVSACPPYHWCSVGWPTEVLGSDAGSQGFEGGNPLDSTLQDSPVPLEDDHHLLGFQAESMTLFFQCTVYIAQLGASFKVR